MLFLAMSTMLGAGVNMVRSLTCAISLTEPDYPELAESLRGIRKRIEDGASFSSAFSAYGWHFSPLHCSLIRTGDQSGDLAQVFAAMAQREEDWFQTRYRVYSALTYPAFMAVILLMMMVVVLPWTVTQMVPIIAAQGQLPWITRFLLQLCQAMQSWPFWLALTLVGWVVWRTFSLSSLREEVLLRLHRAPYLGRALNSAACQAFFYALQLQSQAGLNLHASLRSAADVSGNRVIQQSIAIQSKRLRDGEIELFEVFESFDPIVVQSIVTLQETGQAERVFPVLAKFYQQQLQDTLEKALSMLNPLVTLLMGVIIGGVVVATALPIVKLVDSL